MNKIYYSDKYYYFIQKNKIDNVIKFYQSTVNIKKLYYNIKINQVELNPSNNYWDIPECVIKSTPFIETPRDVQYILKQIREYLAVEQNIYFLPVVTIKDIKWIESGIYILDFISEVFYQYKEYDKNIFSEYSLKEDFKLCISYFLDVDLAVFLGQEAGFTNGIFQIGQFYEKIRNILEKYNIKTYTTFLSQQAFTHNIGVNGRKQLLITNQFMRSR